MDLRVMGCGLRWRGIIIGDNRCLSIPANTLPLAFLFIQKLKSNLNISSFLLSILSFLGEFQGVKGLTTYGIWRSTTL